MPSSKPRPARQGAHLVNCAGIGPPAKVIGREGQPLPLADLRRSSTST
jgi:hypothetical protein